MKEYKTLKQEMVRIKEENEILKKAMAILAKKCTPGGSNPLKTLVYGNIKHTKEKGANCPKPLISSYFFSIFTTHSTWLVCGNMSTG
ncbi:hypothetical protein FDN13_12645 [Caloramator sp. E03]|nr:hypothetical protein FDN13_12645 [Caloramator sp. E03]